MNSRFEFEETVCGEAMGFYSSSKPAQAREADLCWESNLVLDIDDKRVQIRVQKMTPGELTAEELVETLQRLGREIRVVQ